MRVGENSSLTVAIPTAGRSDLLMRTLRSLAECELPASYCETLVVENGPVGNARAAVERCPAHLRAKYVHSPNPCKSDALNRVLELVDETLIVMFDDDVRIGAGTLCAYADAARDADRCTFFGGPVEIDYELEPPAWLKPYLPRSATGWNIGYSKRPDQPIFLGPNWAAFSRTLRAAGGFDPRLGPGTSLTLGDESNMQKRLYKAGCRGAYVADAVVWHYVPVSRCSPQWALARANRQGMEYGLDLDRADMAPKLFGVPRWLVRTWVSDLARFFMTRFAVDRQTRFDGAYRLRWSTGLIQGSRVSHDA